MEQILPLDIPYVLKIAPQIHMQKPAVNFDSEDNTPTVY